MNNNETAMAARISGLSKIISETIRENAIKTGLTPLEALSAITMAQAIIMNENSSTKDLESARNILDTNKSYILDILCEADWK